VSHAHNKTRRRWLPNLQTVKVQDEKGENTRIRVCTNCIKSGRVKKAPVKKVEPEVTAQGVAAE
jgi:large subunit ribosomal protein L28